MKGKRYIFFDLDGTLIDSHIGITRSVAYALDRLDAGVEDPDSLTHFIGPPLAWSFRECCGFDPDTVARALSLYREYYVAKGIYQNKLYDGIIPMLEELGVTKKLLIATSKLEYHAAQIGADLGFGRYFAGICGSEDGGVRSSKAEVIAYAMERCGCENPDEIVMVGDRMHDIVGAKANHVESVGVLYGFGDRQELEEAGADAVVETVEELAALLGS